MPTIVISGLAHAFAENPRARKPISDRTTLARFHGLASEQSCVDAFDEPLSELNLSGGQLRLVLDEKGPNLRITTSYLVPRRLSDEETELLLEATKTQWSDGIGSGSFTNCCGTVLSTALGMAILNTNPKADDLGEYFVDVYPLFADESETRVEFHETDPPEKTDFDYLQEAAEFGNPDAQYLLARELEAGDTLEKNEPLAFENFKKAAAQGHLFALAFLGLCWQRGVGTPPDLKQGFECFAKAAEAGLTFAMHCLGECYIEGRGVEANPELGVNWYRRGVDLGDVGCTAQLGDCYEYGRGVPKDLHQALELYERCMEAGFDPVEPAIARVQEELEREDAR